MGAAGSVGAVDGGAGLGGLSKDVARIKLGDAFDEAKFDEAGEFLVQLCI